MNYLDCILTAERYLNHPTFGMLYLVSPSKEEGVDLYATLYAQKMFFLVKIKQRNISFEVIPYLDARNLAEINLIKCRRSKLLDVSQWENLFKQTFI